MNSEGKRYKSLRKLKYYNNHDKNLARAERYRDFHRDLINKKRVKYYWNNLEKSRGIGKETMRKRRISHRERVNIINHNYYLRNKEGINRARRERLLKDPEYREKINQKQREWYHKRKLAKVQNANLY